MSSKKFAVTGVDFNGGVRTYDHEERNREGSWIWIDVSNHRNVEPDEAERIAEQIALGLNVVLQLLDPAAIIAPPPTDSDESE